MTEWRSRLEQLKHLARGIATCPVGDCVSCKTAGRLLLERIDDLAAALPEGEEPGWRDIRKDAEAMADRLRALIANPAYADTRSVLEIRLETIEILLDPPSDRTMRDH